MRSAGSSSSSTAAKKASRSRCATITPKGYGGGRSADRARDNRRVTRLVTVLVLLALAMGATAWRLADVKPDPNVQAIADGCQRDTTKIYTGFAPNWVYVNDRDFPAPGPPPAPRWVTGVVHWAPQRLLASRIASSDDPITHHSFDIEHRRPGRPRRTTSSPAPRATGRPSSGTIHLERESDCVSGVGAAAGRRPDRGARLVGLGLRPLPAERREDGVPSVPRRLGAPAPGRAVADEPARRGRGRPLRLHRRDARGHRRPSARTRRRAPTQFKTCWHAAADWLSVNGDYAFSALRAAPGAHGRAPRLAGRRPRQRRRAADPVAPARRLRLGALHRRRAGRASASSSRSRCYARLDEARRRSSTCASTSTGCSCAARWIRPARPTSRRARRRTSRRCSGRSRRRPASGSCTGASTASGAAGPGRSPARDGSTFDGTPVASTSTSQRGGPWTLVTLARECDFGALPGFDGPGHPMRAVPAVRTRSATRRATTTRARSRSRYRGAGARPPRRERLDGRLDLPGRRTRTGAIS